LGGIGNIRADFFLETEPFPQNLIKLIQKS